MAKKRIRYKQMEREMLRAILADAVLFVAYLFAAGTGIIWFKAVTAILTIFLSGLCLYHLYISKELLRQRSLWMTVSAAAILLCVMASLILKFPSPKPTLSWIPVEFFRHLL